MSTPQQSQKRRDELSECPSTSDEKPVIRGASLLGLLLLVALACLLLISSAIGADPSDPLCEEVRSLPCGDDPFEHFSDDEALSCRGSLIARSMCCGAVSGILNGLPDSQCKSVEGFRHLAKSPIPDDRKTAIECIPVELHTLAARCGPPSSW